MFYLFGTVNKLIAAQTRVRSMEILTVTLIYPYKDRNGNEAENEARFNSKVTVSSCVITSVKTQNILFNTLNASKVTASENV